MNQRRPISLTHLAIPLTALLSATVLASPHANAQTEVDAGARALAVQLYDEAEALFAKDDTAAACPKYAESYRLDPQLGVLIYLAECLEKNQQLAGAWGSFREAEEIARKRSDVRADSARDRAAALEPRLSYVVVQVPAASAVAGLELLRDGVPVAKVLWGQRAAIDAGSHRIEARATGYKPWRKDVSVDEEGSVATIEVPRLVAEPKAVNQGNSPERSLISNLGTRRISAIAVGGLGLVGIGVGSFFGLSSQASWSEAKTRCNDNNFCTGEGNTARKNAESKALVATIATGAGIAALGAGAVLWFTAPKLEKTNPDRQAARAAWLVAPTSDSWGMEVHHAF